MFDRKIKIKKKIAASFGKVKSEFFDFESIEKYFRKKDKSNSLQVISDKTCNDLDFEEFFMFVDRTTSKIGQQFLYDTLRTIPENRDIFPIQEEMIKKLQEDSELRSSVQFHLSYLSDKKAFYVSSLIQDEHIKPPKWFFVIRLLSFTSLMSILMAPFAPQLLFVLLVVFIVNLGIHYWNKNNLYEYLASIPQLLKLNSVAKELIRIDLFNSISKDLDSSIKTIDKVRRRMSFFKLEAKMEGDIQIAFWAMLEFVKTLFLLEPQLLFGALKQLDTRRNEIDRVFSFVGYIDSIISIASLRKGLNLYSIPEVNKNDKSIYATDIYHPLIPDCITNSIETNGKSILLTGSNMSGKTTFIRTIGLNTISALTINTCFAAKFRLPVLSVYSAIRISDDLMNDKSYYFEEVLTIKNLIEKSQQGASNLFLLDEIFKGTNTIERVSAGKAVLSALAKNGNLVFVSTHDIELTDMLNEEYELYHFSEQVENNSVDFDFKLKTGKLKNRNAIRILKINDYPDFIIEEALEISSRMDMINRGNKEIN